MTRSTILRKKSTLAFILSIAVAATLAAQAEQPRYKYIRVGNAADVATQPEVGLALMGGGKDLDAAFQWLGSRAHGGDFLVLRAAGSDAYNPYIEGLVKLNSVATLIIPSREAASDPFVAQAIARAEALFIAGGDQANYINFWKDTPVQTAINDALHRGVPIGGTSAGLAVQGEYLYSAQNDPPDDSNLTSAAALANPFNPRVDIVHGFLDNPLLADTITDSHFAARDRMGRLLVFMAHLHDAGVATAKGIGIDQGAAVLLEPTGQATIVGQAAVYFLRSTQKPTTLKASEPLTSGPIEAEKLYAGDTFNLKTWKSSTPTYTYTVVAGKVSSSQNPNTLY